MNIPPINTHPQQFALRSVLASALSSKQRVDANENMLDGLLITTPQEQDKYIDNMWTTFQNCEYVPPSYERSSQPWPSFSTVYGGQSRPWQKLG